MDFTDITLANKDENGENGQYGEHGPSQVSLVDLLVFMKKMNQDMNLKKDLTK